MSDGQALRENARQAFKDSGFTYAVLLEGGMQRLRTHVHRRMKESGCMLGTYRCRQRGVVKETSSGLYGELRCRADYFDDREAVSFNTDGFVGFAGWADSENVKPVIDGFMDWLTEISAGRAARMATASSVHAISAE